MKSDVQLNLRAKESQRALIDAAAEILHKSRTDFILEMACKAAENVILDRRVSEKRVFPAININKSGTRREELLTAEDELQRMWILRKLLHPMDEIAAIDFLLDKLKQTKTNEEFFMSMKRK